MGALGQGVHTHGMSGVSGARQQMVEKVPIKKGELQGRREPIIKKISTRSRINSRTIRIFNNMAVVQDPTMLSVAAIKTVRVRVAARSL